MTLFQAVVLGIVQGLTEFIPISSSGHLLLISWVLGWSPPSLIFDVAVHWGTVISVLAVFWHDWLDLIQGGFRALKERKLSDPSARLLFWVIVTAIPAMIIGFLFEDVFKRAFEAPLATSFFLLITAALLVSGDILARANDDLSGFDPPDSLIIGLAQAIAILPGISRSGATIAAGRWQGLSREAAARFSFLLATPTILGAALYKMTQTAVEGTLVAQIPVLAGGLLTATVVGYVCIRWLMRYLREGALWPFAVYCALAGITGLILAFIP